MVSSPNESSIAKNGVAEPMVELVGVCMNISLADCTDQDKSEIVEQILSLFQTTWRGTTNFVSATNRIFLVDHIQRQMATEYIRHITAGIQGLQRMSYDEHTVTEPEF